MGLSHAPRVSASSVAVALFLIATGAVAAQDNPLGQPLLDASGNIRDDAYIHIPLRPDDARYGDIRGEQLKGWLMEVDAISLADRDGGNLFWGRNVGTEGHEATQAWVEHYFRQYGLTDVHHEEFDLDPIWNPKSFSISFVVDGRTFELESARPRRTWSPRPRGPRVRARLGRRRERCRLPRPRRERQGGAGPGRAAARDAAAHALP